MDRDGSCSSSNPARFPRNLAMTVSSVWTALQFFLERAHCGQARGGTLRTGIRLRSNGQIAQQQAHLVDDIQFFILVPRYEICY